MTTRARPAAPRPDRRPRWPPARCPSRSPPPPAEGPGAQARPAPAPGLSPAPDSRALRREPPPLPPRFAFVRTPVWDKADSDTKAAFEELAAELGSAVGPVDLPPSWTEAWEVHRTIMAADMAHNLGPLVARGEPSEALRKLLAHGRAVSAVDYLDALAKAQRYAAGLADIFDAYDAIVTPAAPGVAPKGLRSTRDPALS